MADEKHKKYEIKANIWMSFAIATLLRLIHKNILTKKDKSKIEKIEAQMWHYLSDGE